MPKPLGGAIGIGYRRLEGQAMTTPDTRIVIVVTVTKSRKGWQVSTIDTDGVVHPVAWFVGQTEAYACAWRLEHGI